MLVQKLKNLKKDITKWNREELADLNKKEVTG